MIIMLKTVPFSLALVKTVTSFKLTPRPLLMVTASLASVFKPRRIEPFEWALENRGDRGKISSSFREYILYYILAIDHGRVKHEQVM